MPDPMRLGRVARHIVTFLTEEFETNALDAIEISSLVATNQNDEALARLAVNAKRNMRAARVGRFTENDRLKEADEIVMAANAERRRKEARVL